MNFVIVMNFVLTVILSVAWGSSNWSNLLIKLVFITAMVFNAVATFQQFGYIVKV